jgi:predicted Zn finger-like uncharacterized protein
MSLVTKCTSCGTTFRVSQQQLQAHNGRVRCGNCMTVFDGLSALVTVLEPRPEAKPQGADITGAASFELQPVAPAAGPAADATSASAARAPEAAREEKDHGPAPEQLSLDDQLYPEAPRRSARGWAVGTTLLAFVLGGQAAFFYRADLAAQYPGLKPHLVQFCDLLHCTVTLPQRPRQIAIEASDLQATDAAQPRIIQLTATLRNYAGHDLGYPALDLVLTDSKEHTLARRIFLPEEYLVRGTDIASGIPANAEITVRLDLDTSDLNPAGFRLDLLPAL